MDLRFGLNNISLFQYLHIFFVVRHDVRKDCIKISAVVGNNKVRILMDEHVLRTSLRIKGKTAVHDDLFLVDMAASPAGTHLP